MILRRKAAFPVSPIKPAIVEHVAGVTPRCPHCESRELVRVQRRWWMRLVPHSRRFGCHTCKKGFLQVWRPEQ
ncbi:MAG: hypothetical protein ACQETD_06515 [Pseudomonadota bacterium]